MTNKSHKAYIKAYGIPKPTVILPHLVLGSKYDLYEPETYKTYNVKFILCCAEECDHSDMKIPKHVILKHLPIQDDWDPKIPPQSDNFEEAVSFIDQVKLPNNYDHDIQEETCYVHCMRGRSRSSSVVLAYLMLKEHLNLKESYHHVKSMRPFIGPHYGLRIQMIHLEYHWKKEKTFQLKEWEQSHIDWKRKKKEVEQIKEIEMEKEEQESILSHKKTEKKKEDCYLF
eukprot:gene4763-8345_t